MEDDDKLRKLIESLPLRLKTPKLIPVINPKTHDIRGKQEARFWGVYLKGTVDWVFSVGCPISHPVWAAVVHPIGHAIRIGRYYVVWADIDSRDNINEYISFSAWDYNTELKARLLEQAKEW